MGMESRNLDLLRAVAVLCVLVAHLILTLTPEHHVFETVRTPGVDLLYKIGNIGVLLFFVHTSLVLMLSLERGKPGSLFLNFYVRRLFRIYPLSIFCICMALVVRVPFWPDVPFAMPSWRAILANLLLVQDLTRSGSVISPLWSLPRELQMYAVLPFLFILLRRFGSSPLVLVLWWAASLAAPYVQLLAFLPCFMGGVFAYQLSKERTYRLPAAIWPAALIAGIALNLWGHYAVSDDYRPDFVVCMLIGALIPNFKELPSTWLTAAGHIVAKYSYGIYLFHVPVLWFAFVKLHALPSPVQWAAFCVLLCVIPWAAYTYIEAPLIGLGRRVAGRLTPWIHGLQAKIQRPAYSAGHAR